MSTLPELNRGLTSVDDTLVVQILDCTCDCPDNVLGIPLSQLTTPLEELSALLVVTPSSADPVK